MVIAPTKEQRRSLLKQEIDKEKKALRDFKASVLDPTTSDNKFWIDQIEFKIRRLESLLKLSDRVK